MRLETTETRRAHYLTKVLQTKRQRHYTNTTNYALSISILGVASISYALK